MKKLVTTTLSFALFAMAAISQTDTDKKEIVKAVATIEEGWMQKDGKKFASPFAEVHDFIVWNGYYFPNETRAMAAMSHQRLFDGPFKTWDIRLKVDKMKFIRPDIALIHVLGVGYDKGKEVPANPGVLMSLLFEKKDGIWEIIAFHNLDLETFQNEEVKKGMPFPAEVMYANWYK
ncbi:MAG: SgcJ/EcaC family oxidoreductase [Bacteroidota bacterium]